MNTNYDVINSKKYFELLNKNELTEVEQQKTQKFEDLMNKADKYRDYLTGTLKDNKDSYEKGINQLAILETTEPDIKLTAYQQKAIDAYNKQKSNALELRENKLRVLEKHSDVSGGYTNSFILILSVLATGILIGVVLFLMVK